MALTIQYVDIPTTTVGPNFHSRLQFNKAIDFNTLMVSDVRLRRSDGMFFQPLPAHADFFHEGNNLYRIDFTVGGLLTGSFDYQIRIPANNVTASDGEQNSTVNSGLFSVDVDQDLSIEITYAVTEGTGGVQTTATITANQPVSGLEASGFSLVNGTIGAFAVVSETEFTLQVTPDAGSGTMTLTLAADSVNEGNAEVSEPIDYSAPTPPPPLNPPTFTAPAANYEVNERADDSIDATAFFTGHTGLAFRSGYTAPSWLTISGVNVVITDAPDVLEATEFTVPLTATNGDGSVNGSITISVQQIDPAPVFGTPNRFDINEGSSSVFDLSGDLQHAESLAYQSGYSAPSWLTISGLTLVITDAEQVSQDTDFDVLLAAASTKTAATANRTVTIRVRDVDSSTATTTSHRCGIRHYRESGKRYRGWHRDGDFHV